MAKNKVFLDIVVDDKGTTKRLAVDAARLSDALNKAGVSAGTADRRLKGAAQASSNGSKNFAKMAQGIQSGLVPAYATLAANVFAISAAFQFLKRAADYDLLMKSQVSFAKNTGTALTYLSKNLQDASQNMLSFQEAAAASAMGAAKGFTGGQMNAIAAGASKVSQALGRDFADSFDRLVRGISKAEPELLDELGITLRLQTATEDYAKAINKSADDLSAYERSQAVLKETMRQLEEQFGSIEPKANVFQVLGNTFDSIIKNVNQYLLPVFEAFAGILNTSAAAALITFGALGYTILKAALPIDEVKDKISNMGKSSEAAYAKASRKAEIYSKLLERQKRQIDAASRAQAMSQQQAARNLVSSGAQSRLALRVATGETLPKGKQDQLKKALASAEKNVDSTGKVISGVFKGTSVSIIRDMRQAMNTTSAQAKLAASKTKLQWVAVAQRFKVAMAKMSLASKVASRMIVGTFVVAGKAINKAMSAAGFIGMVMMIIEAVRYVYDNVYSLIHGLLSMIDKAINGIMGVMRDFAQWVYEKIANIPLVPKVIKDGLKSFAEGSTESAYAAEFAASGIGKMLNAHEVGRKAAKAQQEAIDDLTESLKRLSENAGQSSQGVAEALAAGQNDKATMIKSRFASSLTMGGEFGRITAYKAAAEKDPKKALSAFKEGLQGLKDSAKNMPNIQAALNFDIATASADQILAAAEALKTIEENGTAVVTNQQALVDSAKDLSGAYKNFATGGDYRALLSMIEMHRKKNKDLIESAASMGGLDTSSLMGGAEDADLARIKALVVEQDRLNQIEHENNLTKIENTRLTGMFKEAANEELLLAEKKLAVSREDLKLQALREQLKQAGTNQTEVDRINAEISAVQKGRDEKQQDYEQTKNNLTNLSKIGMGLGESLQSNFTSAFQSLVDGTASFKDAFGNMAKSILSDLSKMLVKMLAMKALESMFGGSVGSFLGFGGDGARYGGVFSNGGKVDGYRTGGIAKGSQAGYPAVLHGTEAVVPLPNGKSIPVQMKGAGQQNNVVVNVSVDSKGGAAMQTEGQSSNDAGNLGKAIAAAVQQELQNQKRSGGILNPYGVA